MGNWWLYIVIGVVLVGMILLTVIPQKKRQKQQQQMMDSLAVGTKIMTIGRMVGKITQINPDNTLVINVGTELSPTLIVIDRNAVGLVLENVAAPAPVVTDTATDAPVESQEVFDSNEESSPAEAAEKDEADEEKKD